MKPGKPGSLRIRGILRQQVKQVLARCNHFLAVDTAGKAKVPPITFLSDLGVAAVTACRDEMILLRDQKN